MKFVDLNKEFYYYHRDIDQRWEEIKTKGMYFFGDQTNELERRFPKIIGKKYCVTVKNCTDALTLVLKKVYKKGMPIILSNFTAYPTAVACRSITSNLYYVDVDESFTLNKEKLPNIRNGIVVAVNLFGNNCNVEKYAKENNHILIEDCAQSTGSGSGKHCDYSVFSFYPTKPLASMGDGGAICFDTEDVDYFKDVRFYGKKTLGINSRMDEFQAAVVNSKLDSFKVFNKVRINIAKEYKKVIKGIKDNNCIYHQFPVMFRDREKIIKKLNQAEIPYLIHYEKHVNEIDILKGVNPSKVGFRVSDKILSLPISWLDNVEIKKIQSFLYENKSEEV